MLLFCKLKISKYISFCKTAEKHFQMNTSVNVICYSIVNSSCTCYSIYFKYVACCGSEHSPMEDFDIRPNSPSQILRIVGKILHPCNNCILFNRLLPKCNNRNKKRERPFSLGKLTNFTRKLANFGTFLKLKNVVNFSNSSRQYSVN